MEADLIQGALTAAEIVINLKAPGTMRSGGLDYTMDISPLRFWENRV